MTLTKAPFAQTHNFKPAGTNVQALAGPGQLNFLQCYNGSDATIYIQLFDVVAQPANADVPTFAPIPIPAGGYYESSTPRGFVNGCWVYASSTALTLTGESDAGIFFDAGACYN